MEKGTLVEFRVQGTPRLGVLDRPEGKKNWVAMDERGQAHVIHPRDITFQVPGAEIHPEGLLALRTEAETYLDPDSLEVAWEFCQEEGEGTNAPELAQFLFSDDRPALCYAAHCLLSADKIYFKQKGDRYEPRPPAQVEELRHQLEKEAQRQAEWDGFQQRVTAALGGAAIEWQKSDRPRLELVERYVLLGEEANHRTQAQEVLTALGRGPTPSDGFQLLVDLGLWDLHENLALRRSQIPTQFNEETAAMVQHRLQSPPPDPDPQRLDLTHLKVYTVDDATTQEIDDGLSLETLPDGQQRLWIHIADPTRWVTPGDVLDLDARRRSTTLYLPTGMIPMFPLELAAGPMSLIQGTVCCALSFGVILTAAGAIEAYQITPSLIRPTYRLTYEDVDEMLSLGVQAESELLAIAHWSQMRQQWRSSQGAIAIHMPESSIRVVSEAGEENGIDIQLLDDSPARQMVAEMMILAGEVGARYGEAYDLAMPFRSQPQPELPPEEELMQLPTGPVRYSAIRRCMPRSAMGITPARHATLGLDHYSQVTSPIRRYTDLLAHFQIKAHLRGEPLPFSPEEMLELTQGASSAAYEAVLVERQTKRYWAIEYLRQHPDQVWQAMVLRWLREWELLGLVLLEELGLELGLRLDREVALGERFQVRVIHANPRQDVVRVEEVPLSAETPLSV